MQNQSALRIRQSEFGTFMDCRRRWKWEYLEGVEVARTGPTPNLSLGSVFHRAHEAFWTGGDPLAELVKCEEEIAELEGGLSFDWIDTFTMARAMVRHYEAWLNTGETMHEEVRLIEADLEWEVRPGVFITGKIDRLVWDALHEEHVLIDLKTCKSFMWQMTHARQLKTYAVLLRKQGINVSRLATEQVRKVLGTGTAKPPFVGRVSMFVDDDVLDRHETDMQAVLDEMLELRSRYEVGDETRLYPNPTGDCSWKCQWLPLCTAQDNGDSVEYLLNLTYRKKEGDHL